MILELYTVVALMCDKTHCWRATVWTGRDRDMCMAQAVQIRVNPPAHVQETKMSACLVERVKPGYRWETGTWIKDR